MISMPTQNYNYTDEHKPLQINPRKLLIVIGVIFFLIIAVFIISNITRELGAENSEDEEPLIEWAGSDSPLAGIQFLTSKNGLTYEQYSDFYQRATNFFKEKHPNYKYVEYVEGSFNAKLSSGIEENADDCDVESVTYSDDGTEIISSLHCDKDELATRLLVFKLQSNSGDEYSVEIDPSFAIDRVDFHLFDSTGEKLL